MYNNINENKNFSFNQSTTQVGNVYAIDTHRRISRTNEASLSQFIANILQNTQRVGQFKVGLLRNQVVDIHRLFTFQS